MVDHDEPVKEDTDKRDDTVKELEFSVKFDE